MKQIIPAVKSIKIIDTNNFVARVNNKDYHGSFSQIGNIKVIDYMKEVNSLKQTTWKIITFTESALNKI